MASIRIYQPAKTAMQSSSGNTRRWLIEFESCDALIAEPLMGWIKSKDMRRELHLSFSSLERALRFAKLKGLTYTVSNPCKVSITPKNYATNFTNPRIRGI